MDKLLEGKELDKKFDGDAGEIFIDVDKSGGIKISLNYDKDLDGYVAIKSSVSIDTNLISILEKFAAKSATTLDDTAIATIKTILGLLG